MYGLSVNIRKTKEIVCKIGFLNKDGCPRVNRHLAYDASYGPETITWTDADNDPYSYKLYVYDDYWSGVAKTGASITLYGETEVKMQVVDGDSEEP